MAKKRERRTELRKRKQKIKWLKERKKKKNGKKTNIVTECFKRGATSKKLSCFPFALREQQEIGNSLCHFFVFFFSSFPPPFLCLGGRELFGIFYHPSFVRSFLVCVVTAAPLPVFLSSCCSRRVNHYSLADVEKGKIVISYLLFFFAKILLPFMGICILTIGVAGGGGKRGLKRFKWKSIRVLKPFPSFFLSFILLSSNGFGFLAPSLVSFIQFLESHLHIVQGVSKDEQQCERGKKGATFETECVERD